MYIATHSLTVTSWYAGERAILKGDSITNWRYFWMKKLYKPYFVKPNVYYFHNPEEEYRREMQERDEDLGGLDKIYVNLADQNRIVPPPDDWYPHDDHMVVVHPRVNSILEEDIEDIDIDDNPALNWSTAIQADQPCDTTSFDDPNDHNIDFGPPPVIDDIPTDYRDDSSSNYSSNDSTYNSGSDFGSTSSDYSSDTSSNNN